MNDLSPKTAKLFWTGRSQAVRLPKEFRFNDEEVAIYRREDGAVVLEPIAGDRLAHLPADGAAHAVERLREAIGRGLDSGPVAAWDANEIKRRARER